MEAFIQRFGSVLQFSYSCFDRIVINGYLPMFQNEANLVYFFRTIGGVEQMSKEILAGRTDDYRDCVEGYALISLSDPVNSACTGYCPRRLPFFSENGSPGAFPGNYRALWIDLIRDNTLFAFTGRIPCSSSITRKATHYGLKGSPIT